MFSNELLGINIINQKDYEPVFGFNFTIIYSNKSYGTPFDFGNNKCLLLPAFESVQLQPVDNLLAIIQINLNSLKSLITNKELLLLQNLLINEWFLNDLDLMVESLLEVMDKSNKLEQLTYSSIFIDKLIKNLKNEDLVNFGNVTAEMNLFEIQKYIHENFASNLDLESLSQEFGYSTSYLSRIFKKSLGIGFSSYLKNVRLNQAINLLSNSTSNITQVSLQSGFGSSSVFNRIFKEAFQVTPSEFRENSRTSDHVSSKMSDLHEKNQILREIQNRKTRIVHDFDATSRIINRFSPFNRVLNIRSIDFFDSSFNKIQLVKAKDLFKCNTFRFQVSLQEFLSSDTLKLKLQNIFETLAVYEAFPFVSFNFDVDFTNQSTSKDVVAQTIINFFINEINKYNIEKFSKWFIEFQLAPLVSNEFEKNSLEVLETVCAFFDLALESNSVVLNLGSIPNNLSALDFSVLNHLSLKYLSFEISIDSLGVSIRETTKIAEAILQKKEALSSLTNRNHKIIISSMKITNDAFAPFYDELSTGSFYLELCSLLFQQFEIITLHSTFDTRPDKNELILHGSDGLFTYNGINKSSSHALIFLRKLGSSIIDIDQGIFVSKKSMSDYVIILSNFQSFSNQLNPLNPHFDNYFGNNQSTKTFDISLNNVMEGSYKLKVYHSKTDETNLREILTKFGNVSNLQDDELQTIEYDSRPKLMLSMIKSVDGSIQLAFDLKVNEFAMIYVYYQY